MRNEEIIHIQICDYLRAQYPKVMFLSEASGIRVSTGLAVKMKKMRSNHTHADLYVMKPVGEYHGLILELKAKTIYKEDGVTLLKNEHVRDQQHTIDELNRLGYKASFAVGFKEAKKIIDDYLNGNSKG